MTTGKTLTKRLSHLRISESDDLPALFPADFRSIVLHCEVVEIVGTISWPERDVTIQARQVVALGDTAVLDVSGAPAAPSFGPEDAAGSGTPAAPDGQPGAAGGDGSRGGDVTIVVHEVIGDLQIRSNGSDGGNGQRGGDGVQPARPDGVDAAWKDSRKPEQGSLYGGRKLQGGTWWVAWAAGQAGHPARRGGNAGAGGRPGAGGDAGRIQVRTSVGADNVSAICRGGLAGGAPPVAAAGVASEPGRGGKNRLYYQEYSIFGAKMAGHGDNWVGAKSGHVPYYKKKYQLADNNKDSTQRAEDGTVPSAPEPGANGRSQTPQVETAPPAEMAAEVSVELLALTMSRAQRDVSIDPDLTRRRCSWLLDLTEGTTNDGLRALRQTAASLLSEVANSVDVDA